MGRKKLETPSGYAVMKNLNRARMLAAGRPDRLLRYEIRRRLLKRAAMLIRKII